MAIGLQTRFVNKQSNVDKAVEKAAFENISHAAFSIRKIAAASIKRAPQGEPSVAGMPPHTHRRAFYRRALWVDVRRKEQDAVIGFRKSKIGMAAAMQEHGREDPSGRFRFPKRPTIGPALEEAIPRIGGRWQGSIGA